MLFGLVDLNCGEYLELTADSITRVHEYKLFVNYARLNIRKHFFTDRVFAVWNNLENVVEFSNLKCFKHAICPIYTLVFN